MWKKEGVSKIIEGMKRDACEDFDFDKTFPTFLKRRREIRVRRSKYNLNNPPEFLILNINPSLRHLFEDDDTSPFIKVLKTIFL